MSEFDGHNGHNKIDPLDMLTHDDLQKLAENSEKWPSCPSCGSPVGAINAFCGQCGTKNAGFTAEAFKLEVGMSIEEIKEQEGCEKGHPAATEDPDRTAQFCIYCGKKY